MDIKVYHTLHKDAVKIRKEVFMEEQGFHDEFDETDHPSCPVHRPSSRRHVPIFSRTDTGRIYRWADRR